MNNTYEIREMTGQGEYGYEVIFNGEYIAWGESYSQALAIKSVHKDLASQPPLAPQQDAHVKTTYGYAQAQLADYDSYDPAKMTEMERYGWNILRDYAMSKIRNIWAHGMGA